MSPNLRNLSVDECRKDIRSELQRIQEMCCRISTLLEDIPAGDASPNLTLASLSVERARETLSRTIGYIAK